MSKVSKMMDNNKKRFVVFLVFALLVVCVASVFYYRVYRTRYVTTDDAFVTGRIHVIASKVPGTVRAIYVEDNQFVKKDDVLLEIDDRDYDVRVREAESARNAEHAKLEEISTKVDVTRKQLRELQFTVKSARANLKLQEANLKQADLDFKRAQVLRAKEVVPEERLEKAKTNFDVTAAQVEAAREHLKQVEAALGNAEGFDTADRVGLQIPELRREAEGRDPQSGGFEEELYENLCARGWIYHKEVRGNRQPDPIRTTADGCCSPR